jgi:hypothetical protein
MSTEEAMKLLTPVEETDTAKSEPEKVETPSVEPAKEEDKSEPASVEHSEDTAAKDSEDVKSEPDGTKGSDDPEDKKEEDKKNDPPKSEDKKEDPAGGASRKDGPEGKTQKEQRDYTLLKAKQKYKDAKKRIAEKDEEIKKLREEIDKFKGLEAKHFKNEDGSTNTDAYMNFKFKEKDMQDQIRDLTRSRDEEQRAMDIEQDRIITERCFHDEELKQYRELVDKNGQGFLEALQENDPKGVVLGYLDTLQEYPVVLRELMDLNKNPHLLGRLFRSRDPYSLHRSIAQISDEILDNWHKKPEPVPDPTPAPAPEVKKAQVPILGKQMTHGASKSETPGSLLSDMSTMNNWLKQHPRGR